LIQQSQPGGFPQAVHFHFTLANKWFILPQSRGDQYQVIAICFSQISVD
jgi:hypothetical protein